MVEETYSAGLISQSFWFVEMKKVIKLIDEGKSEEEIKKMCIDENLFGAAKEYRAKRIYGYIWNRAKRLDKTLIDLFCTSDLATQKVINLIASEIVRYKPEQMAHLLNSKENWLLHEFLTLALDQFIDELAAEITGQDIMCTGVK